MKTQSGCKRTREKGTDEERGDGDVTFICKGCKRLKYTSFALNADRNICNSFNMCFRSGLTLTTKLSVVLIVIWMHLALLVTFSEGFNLDTVKALKFDGPHPGSYFGFTVEMMNKDPRNKWYV